MEVMILKTFFAMDGDFLYLHDNKSTSVSGLEHDKWEGGIYYVGYFRVGYNRFNRRLSS